MDWKLLFTILATTTGIGSFYPYLKGMYHGTTKPHMYTWLIWTITQGTAVLGLIKGGGGTGVYAFFIGTLLVGCVFIYSNFKGSSDITRLDSLLLIGALLGFTSWFYFSQHIISIIIVTIVDLIGYIPSIRKTWKDPESETPVLWALFVVSGIFVLASLARYNILTTLYMSMNVVMNSIMTAVCLRKIKRLA